MDENIGDVSPQNVGMEIARRRDYNLSPIKFDPTPEKGKVAKPLWSSFSSPGNIHK